MEPIPELHHASSEIGNEYACQKVIKTWIDTPQIPSSHMIPSLHVELMRGVSSYQTKGLVPLAPGSYRLTDVSTEGRVDNYVSGFDVAPLMQRYTHDLDAVLQKEPESPGSKLEETMHDAAWAYFVFSRIHPFLDGNGRLGRMILKRVIKGRGYKDIIFQTNAAYGGGRAAHIDAMTAVDTSGNLAHLELYLLDQLQMRYVDDVAMSQKISDLMLKKRELISSQTERRDLTEIWDGFKGLHLDGVKTHEYAQFSKE